MNKIKFGDIVVGNKARSLLMECCDTNFITAGPLVKKFEERWSELFGYKYTVATSSGTTADTIACMSLFDFGAKPKDEVICPALAFAAVGNSIRAADLTPVFVDIRSETLNINEDLIEEKITNKTRAIFVVHTMGKPVNMDKIMRLATKYNLKVIEDSCEAPGAKYQNKYVGTFGDIFTCSFYIAHVANAAEFGVCSTRDKKLSDVLLSIRSHGREPNNLYFNHVRYGINAKPTDLHAAIGLESLDYFWSTFIARKTIYYKLIEAVQSYSDKCYFSTEDTGDTNCPHGFSFTLKEYNKEKFNSFTSYFTNANIDWKRNFGSMPTQHKAFEHYGYKLGNFPQSEHVGDMGIHIGLSQYYNEEQINRIITTSVEALKSL